MSHKILFNRLIISLILLSIFVNCIGVALADDFTPPGVPTPVPKNNGGGGGHSGGGGGGSSYTAPVITYPKYVDVKNSNGDIIGLITQASASDISLAANETITVGSQTYKVFIEAKLNSLPSDAKLDIIGETPDYSTLPAALTVNDALAQFTLSKFSSGWDIKSGTLKLTLVLPQDMIGSADLSKSLIVRYDGTSYELLMPSGTPAADSGSITYVVVSPHETFGYNSVSKYMLVTAATLPTPTPTPVPTEVPTAEPPQGPSLVTVLLALMLAAVVAAAFVLYFMMQRKS